MNIGFIGLGNMGKPMAMNLLNANHDLIVYDLSAEACHALSSQGAQRAPGPGHVAPRADVVITMLQTHEQVAQCCLVENGIFDQIDSHNALFIDCSTVDIEASRQLHQQAADRGIAMLDAPVSGGVAAAELATLTFMVGGRQDDVKKATPILSQLGKSVIHAGPAGNGAAAKICNNLMLAISMIGVCEGFTLAEQLGLKAEKLFEICSQSSAQCWSLNQYCPFPGLLDNVPSSHDFKPGFSTQMMLKDLKLGQAAAQQTSSQLPMSNLATDLFQRLTDLGNGNKDFSSIIQMIRQQLDIEPTITS